MGVDYGRKRVGIALSDGLGIAAHPYEVLEAGPGLEGRLAELVDHNEVTTVVVGLPTSLDGSERSSAKLARRFAARIGALLDIDVVLYDERFTIEDRRAGPDRGGYLQGRPAEPGGQGGRGGDAPGLPRPPGRGAAPVSYGPEFLPEESDHAGERPIARVKGTVVALLVSGLVVYGLLVGGQRAGDWVSGLGRFGAEDEVIEVQPGRTVKVEVPVGSSARGIAGILVDNGVIRSAVAFESVVRSRQAGSLLKGRGGTSW